MAALLLFGAISCTKEVTKPMPEKKPQEMEIHGDVRVDDYFWLNERENPDVIAYLEQENAYTESVMRPMAGWADAATWAGPA